MRQVSNSKTLRAGAGKARNRRFTKRRGPLVVYDAAEGLEKAFRNLPGVELAMVDNLSLLDLAPGGHLGRFIIWTKGAFEKLDSLFGTYEESAKFKKGFNLPRACMTNADLTRIINSDEVQSVLKPMAESADLTIPKKRNPLKVSNVKIGLNPYQAAVKAREEAAQAKGKAARAKKIAEKRKDTKQFAARRKEFIKKASLDGEISF